MNDKNGHGIANFAALKTAIVNGEEQLLEELLGNEAMQDLERSYLIDLAKLNDNLAIIKILEDIAVKE